MIPIANIGYIIVIGIILLLSGVTIPANDHPNEHVSFDGIGYGIILWFISFVLSVLVCFVDITSKYLELERTNNNHEFSIK